MSRCPVRSEAHVLDEYGLRLFAIIIGDDARHHVNHRHIERDRIGHRLFEEIPEVGLPAGDRRQPALAPCGIPKRRVEQDHVDARVVKPTPYLGCGVGVGGEEFHRGEPQVARCPHAFGDRKVGEHHADVGGESRQWNAPVRQIDEVYRTARRPTGTRCGPIGFWRRRGGRSGPRPTTTGAGSLSSSCARIRAADAGCGPSA